MFAYQSWTQIILFACGAVEKFPEETSGISSCLSSTSRRFPFNRDVFGQKKVSHLRWPLKQRQPAKLNCNFSEVRWNNFSGVRWNDFTEIQAPLASSRTAQISEESFGLLWKIRNILKQYSHSDECDCNRTLAQEHRPRQSGMTQSDLLQTAQSKWIRSNTRTSGYAIDYYFVSIWNANSDWSGSLV